MKKKLLFRADGNSEIGLGHLYRLLSLLEMFKDDYDVIFVTRADSVLEVIPPHYLTKIIPQQISLEEEVNWISKFFKPKDCVLIADGYQFDSLYQKKLKQKEFYLIYIDDLATEYMYADVVVNHSPFVKETDFKTELYTKFLLGVDFAMLRPAFLKAAKEKNTIGSIKNAFVCFGGADKYDLTLRAAQALLNINSIENINIILGGAYKHKDILLLEKDNNKIHLHKNLDEDMLCGLMKSSQIAIAPSSTILYELCCVKMPILSGYYAENQKSIYKGLAEKDIIIEGGNFTNYTVSDFEEKIKTILGSNHLNIFLEKQQNLFRGNSKTNFLGLINKLNISLRKAKAEDILEVYNWSNDTLVRKNSYDSSPIKLEDHKKWFSRKIEDRNTLFLIALVNNKPAGIVRFDINDTHSLVGVLLSKNYRGQKLASEFLKKSARIYFKTNTQPILAYIKKENKASIKVFENARYISFKEEVIKGCTSFVYKLEEKDVRR